MSTGTSMYSLKPIVSLPEQISLPKNMYELPNIQGDGGEKTEKSNEFTLDIERQTPHPEINLLEARQMRILKQLLELKQKVDQLCIAVRLSDVVKMSIDPLPETLVNSEIIINANPESPPYSILALQRIWKNTKFNIDLHCHSTVSNVNTKTFADKILVNPENSEDMHVVNVKVIWKDVSDIQLITKMYDYPIEGEANVLRYLTRVIESYTYELIDPHSTDIILDLSLQLPYEEPRKINAITAKFSNYIGENTWFSNLTEPSIVDVAVWSILKRITPKKIPGQLQKWYDLCEKTFLAN